MEDRRGEHRVGTGVDGRREVLDPPRAARGDDRDGHLAAYAGDEVEVEAVLGAVGVHRVEQDLPRPELAGAGRPLQGVDAGRLAAAVRGDLESRVGALGPTGVHGQHQHLVAEAVSDLRDQLRPADRCSVDRDLVGPGTQQPVDVLGRGHSPAHGEWDEDLLGTPRHDLHGGGATLVRGGDVEERQLVSTLGVVGARQLDRVTGVAEVLEVDPLDHPAAVDVEARDDADGQAHCDAPVP